MQISTRELTRQFDRLRVLDKVSVDFPSGKITALLGANGAGKTTLLRCLAGLSHGNAGSVLLDGETLQTGRLDLRRRLMFLPDFPPDAGDIDIMEMLAMHLKIWQADRPGVEWRVAELLDELHLSAFAGASCATLSRGQRYKAALLALFAVDPDLWLLDEPFASGMDPAGIGVFRRECQHAATLGRTILYSTQIVELAAEFSDHIAVVNLGSVTLYDTVLDFDRDPRRIESSLMTPLKS